MTQIKWHRNYKAQTELEIETALKSATIMQFGLGVWQLTRWSRFQPSWTSSDYAALNL